MSSTYFSWTAMIQRCTNSNHKAFKNYGGRGITICQRWLESFEAFLADMGERPEGLFIERRDNNGDYEPSNCRWPQRPSKTATREKGRAVRSPVGSS